MNKVKVYGYPKCSTCVKAQKYLKSHDIDFDSVDITLQPPSKTALKAMLKSYGGEIKKLLNTSGVKYRELGLSKKLPDMTNDDVINLLADEGKLIKRPFLLINNAAQRVGFKEEEWKSALNI